MNNGNNDENAHRPALQGQRERHRPRFSGVRVRIDESLIEHEFSLSAAAEIVFEVTGRSKEQRACVSVR
jgi:hypothetical protein